MKSHQLFDIQNQVVVVTGAASGIGLAYAEVMALNGAKVTLVDLDEKALADAVLSLKTQGAEAYGEVADVTQTDSLTRAIDAVMARHGRLDVVFANAGISGGPGFLKGDGERNPSGEVENLSLAVWEKVFATNVTSVFQTVQIVVPHMKKQGGGRIIVTSSISASMPESLVSSIYATSKGTVGHMVRQYAFELAKYNILVNAIAPGPVVTNIGGGRLKMADARKPFEQATPLGKIAQPADLQGAAIFLASPASSMVTGTQIVIDGGRVLGRAD
jgi:NAD(P)-dependent dehydrogenase (short-subunit alcohol dehydrogenase family)